MDQDMEHLDERLQALFGAEARSAGPLAVSGAGCRFTSIDLCRPLNPEQVNFLLDALSQFRIVSIAGQDLATFSLAHFERFANHWGAPVPHPNNFLRGGKPAQSDGDSDGPFELIPFERRTVAAVNTTFPGQLQCLPHESPTVLVVANFRGETKAEGQDEVQVTGGGSWHTDIEYEPLPIYISMFLVHKSPVSRDAPGGHWVQDPDGVTVHHPYFEDSDDELMHLRKRLPLNGETAFADTAAAFAALPPTEQAALEPIQLRRRLNAEDEGWLAPLVRTNPRSGIKSLHSPIWASRPRVRPPIEVEGMSMETSRAFLDQLEAHVLQSQFCYDHPHVPGDVTLWDNYMTLHNSPPLKSNINSLDDARLLYRLSCKGEPALSLPRHDAPEWLEAHIAGGYTTSPEIINIA
jgi:alpha-ketoglutarate-dependent taurine dioxygenase